ncbi:MAG: restriction endonuclease subunit R, partial [Bradyrhizobium sp.]|nr:restriction endonuclease subunit R [Bradyrhizobium sp.]
MFDYCQNIEFFGANPELKEAAAARSLSERLFAGRVDLVRALDEKQAKATGFSAGEQAPYRDGEDASPSEPEIRASAAQTLQAIVGGMNADNFIVRQHRRAVEKYCEPKAWETIDDDKRKELVDE